jgi:7,8-dihydroneopterin aldolase/epimerase/oxygenase
VRQDVDNMSMTGFIYMKDVRLHAFHGVDPQELSVGADFLLNIRVKTDLSKAIDSDDVNDTVSYAEMFKIAKAEMAIPSKLLENVAGRIAKGIIAAHPQIESLNISLIKLNPPMGADCVGAGVDLHIINQKTI